MGERGRTNNSYPEELKMQAVKLVTEGNMSYREVAKQLRIRNKTQVEVWLKRYQEGQPFKQKAFRKGRPKIKFTTVEEEMAALFRQAGVCCSFQSAGSQVPCRSAAAQAGH